MIGHKSGLLCRPIMFSYLRKCMPFNDQTHFLTHDCYIVIRTEHQNFLGLLSNNLALLVICSLLLTIRLRCTYNRPGLISYMLLLTLTELLTACDGFVSMPPLISLITCRAELHCLITCRVELHCFAWSFGSHVDVRWLLVSYQAFVVLRCRC